VRALEVWLAAAAVRFGPVFRRVDRWGGIDAHRLQERTKGPSKGASRPAWYL
jgi:hypothetical protein